MRPASAPAEIPPWSRRPCPPGLAPGFATRPVRRPQRVVRAPLPRPHPRRRSTRVRIAPQAPQVPNGKGFPDACTASLCFASRRPSPTRRKAPLCGAFPMRPRGLEPPRAKRSQGPQPWTEGVDASRSVQIVQIARIPGLIGRIGRDGRCQSVVTARPPRSVSAQSRSGRSRAASARYVVIPWGGGGTSLISFARIGVQRSGGQRLAKMHAMRPSGRAALGASNPAQPSRQSSSPMSW